MNPTRRPRPIPILAIAAALALSGIVVAGVVIGAVPRGERPDGAVAAITGRPATPSPTVRPSATPTPTPTPEASPSPSPTPHPTRIPELVPMATPTPDPVLAMNLYRKGDFVSQATKDQCVSAAMQIMLNVIGPKNDRTSATQTALARLAKSLSDAPYGGTEPLGWARGLQQRGAGHYKVVVESTLIKAVRRGVAAIRATGRPVGLLVWRGAHSWVLHGFETTADPAGPDAWSVTRIYVSDPWYPRISRIWGRSRGPNAAITPKQLTEDYLPWKRPTGRYPGMDGKFVLVIPVD
jgi:hypothetical protein